MSHFRWGFDKPNGQRRAALGGSNIPCSRTPTTIRSQPCIVLHSYPSPYVPFLDERLSQGLSKIFKAVLLTEDVYVHQNNGFTFKDSRAGLRLFQLIRFVSLTLLPRPQKCHLPRAKCWMSTFGIEPLWDSDIYNYGTNLPP